MLYSSWESQDIFPILCQQNQPESKTFADRFPWDNLYINEAHMDIGHMKKKRTRAFGKYVIISSGNGFVTDRQKPFSVPAQNWSSKNWNHHRQKSRQK